MIAVELERWGVLANTDIYHFSLPITNTNIFALLKLQLKDITVHFFLQCVGHMNEDQGVIMKVALHNARLITNSDETITSLQWRNVQYQILRKPRSLKQSTTTECILFVGSRLFTVQKPVSGCYVIDQFVQTIVQWSVLRTT